MRRSRDVLFSGRRLSSSERNSEIVVVGGSASDKVGGRPVPAKLVTRTLILLGAMFFFFLPQGRPGAFSDCDGDIATPRGLTAIRFRDERSGVFVLWKTWFNSGNTFVRALSEYGAVVKSVAKGNIEGGSPFRALCSV